MPRLALRYDDASRFGDIADAVDAAGIETEILIALGCEARCAPSELPEGVANRGFWGDSTDASGEQTGSRLWLLEQATATPANAQRAELYASEALSFLVSSLRVRAIRPRATIEGDAIMLEIGVTQRSGLVVHVPFGRVNTGAL